MNYFQLSCDAIIVHTLFVCYIGKVVGDHVHTKVLLLDHVPNALHDLMSTIVRL